MSPTPTQKRGKINGYSYESGIHVLVTSTRRPPHPCRITVTWYDRRNVCGWPKEAEKTAAFASEIFSIFKVRFLNEITFKLCLVFYNYFRYRRCNLTPAFFIVMSLKKNMIKLPVKSNRSLGETGVAILRFPIFSLVLIYLSCFPDAVVHYTAWVGHFLPSFNKTLFSNHGSVIPFGVLKARQKQSACHAFTRCSPIQH